jgi:hypothetical protein
LAISWTTPKRRHGPIAVPTRSLFRPERWHAVYYVFAGLTVNNERFVKGTPIFIRSLANILRAFFSSMSSESCIQRRRRQSKDDPLDRWLLVVRLVVFQGPGAAVTSSKNNARDSGASVDDDDDRNKVGRGELTPFSCLLYKRCGGRSCLRDARGRPVGAECGAREKAWPSCYAHWINFAFFAFIHSFSD